MLPSDDNLVAMVQASKCETGLFSGVYSSTLKWWLKEFRGNSGTSVGSDSMRVQRWIVATPEVRNTQNESSEQAASVGIIVERKRATSRRPCGFDRSTPCKGGRIFGVWRWGMILRVCQERQWQLQGPASTAAAIAAAM